MQSACVDFTGKAVSIAHKNLTEVGGIVSTPREVNSEEKKINNYYIVVAPLCYFYSLNKDLLSATSLILFLQKICIFASKEHNLVCVWRCQPAVIHNLFTVPSYWTQFSTQHTRYVQYFYILNID